MSNNKNFEPMTYLNEKGGSNINSLDFRMLYFRFTHPEGAIVHAIKTLNATMAIAEVKVYLDKRDVPENCVSSAIGHVKANGGDYLKEAIDLAVLDALSLAGFDEKYCRAGLVMEKVEAATGETIQEIRPTMTETSTEFFSEQKEAPGVDELSEPAAVNLPVADEQSMEDTSSDSNAEETESVKPAYDMNTPVDEIVASMTVEDAMNVPVVFQRQESTMGKLALAKPDNIGWYAEKYSGPNNLLRAAAIVLINAAMEKAS